MAELLETLDLIFGLSYLLDALLISFIVSLIGAGGYLLFVVSFRKDRGDIARKNLSVLTDNACDTWETLLGQSAPEVSEIKSRPKGIKIALIVFIGILLLLILLILAIKFGWMKN